MSGTGEISSIQDNTMIKTVNILTAYGEREDCDIEFPLYFLHDLTVESLDESRTFSGMCLPDGTGVSVLEKLTKDGVKEYTVHNVNFDIVAEAFTMDANRCSAEQFFEKYDLAQSAMSSTVASMAKYLDPPEVDELTIREELEQNGAGNGTLDNIANN